MAEINLQVGGRHYQIGCQDGDEPRLLMLAEMVDAKAREAVKVIGANTAEARQLLFAALLLADALADCTSAGEAAAVPPGTELEAIAARLERLASTLEQ